MIGPELNKLEEQVDHFVKSYEQLTLENSSLRKKMSQLAQERIALLDKKQKTIDLVKKVIAQLQDELACQPRK